MTAPAIVWFRRDLRLSDQAALAAAAAEGPVIPVYVLDDDGAKDRKLGGASRWWLHHSLAALDADLRDKGSRLILRRGNAAETLAKLAEETGAAAVHCIRHYERWWRDAEAALAKALPDGMPLCCHDGNYLLPPGTLTTGSGGPFKIYTPFWKALQAAMPGEPPANAPGRIDAPGKWPAGDRLADWKLLPDSPDWAKGFAVWTPGEKAARKQVLKFAGAVGDYDATRNLPSVDGSSRLSPHLHWGEVSPAYVWRHACDADGDSAAYRSELAWRDFAQNIIAQFPDYPEESYRDAFRRFPWRDHRRGTAQDDLEAWRRGRTGYPIVDAGMRQLWTVGWMHNRVRMIAASFLIKHLLIDWRVGERWFWDTLVDADYGNNGVNWQWVSGSGVDSNMFSRIMAPLTQSEKFDAADYIREWVPELASLPDVAIHDPDEAGCRPEAYPAKIIGHREARERALTAYKKVK